MGGVPQKLVSHQNGGIVAEVASLEGALSVVEAVAYVRSPDAENNYSLILDPWATCIPSAWYDLAASSMSLDIPSTLDDVGAVGEAAVAEDVSDAVPFHHSLSVPCFAADHISAAWEESEGVLPYYMPEEKLRMNACTEYWDPWRGNSGADCNAPLKTETVEARIGGYLNGDSQEVADDQYRKSLKRAAVIFVADSVAVVDNTHHEVESGRMIAF